MLYCDCCGECCRNLGESELYKELDRGDGICRYLDGNLCSIYEKRPLLCRIDECYEQFFKELYTKDEYFYLNFKACMQLKKKKE